MSKQDDAIKAANRRAEEAIKKSKEAERLVQQAKKEAKKK